jgi:NAD(P)H-hydrate epimerase
MKTVSVREMRRFEEMAQKKYGVSTLVLMENAGRAVAETCLRYSVKDKTRRKIYIFCGIGNNGGDGLACARFLKVYGVPQQVVMLTSPRVLKKDPLVNFAILRKIGSAPYIVTSPRGLKRIFTEIASAVCAHKVIIVDAIFGTGLRREPAGIFKNAIEGINRSGCPVVAVDCPSGIDLERRKVFLPCVHADVTVSLGFLKKGMARQPIKNLCGKIAVKDIGLRDSLEEQDSFPIVSKTGSRLGW